MSRTILLCLLVAGCTGGADALIPTILPPEPPPAENPIVVAEPLMPAVDGEVIGFPGADVPGLRARYSWTGLGWLGPDDDVVFEAVIMWDYDFSLGCGILRRAPDGSVNTVLMQGQPLPGTGGGTVMHPQLPIEAKGDILVIPARIVGSVYQRGLFAVPKTGGDPVLLAGEIDGEFAKAVITDDGTVVASVIRPGQSVVLAIPPGGEAVEICTGCEPGFSTDGACVVVRKDGGAWSIELDGTPTEILAPGAPAPGSNGSVAAVRDARITPDGSFVVHATTDDKEHPEVLLRIGAETEVLAACGAPAPGTTGTYLTIEPAAGGGADVVFGATIAGDGDAVFRAPAGRPAQLVARTGDPAGDLEVLLSILPREVVGGERVAFAAQVGVEQGVFLDGVAGVERVLTTDARLLPLPDATIERFLYPLRDAISSKSDGRTLVHIGIREDRRPSATLGALLLVRN